MISRQTKQKALLSKHIVAKKGFFTAEELLHDLGSNDSGIGIATIYRFLKAEAKAHRLYPYICDRRTVYSQTMQSHCHFECEKTGKIVHFTINNLDFLKGKIPGNITSINLIVKGVCDSCGTLSSKKKNCCSHLSTHSHAAK